MKLPLAVVPAIFLFLAFASRAEISLAQTPVCVLNPQSFASLQKSGQESPDSIREELNTRKTLLRAVLDCLDKEVRDQRTELDRTPLSDQSMHAVRNNLMLALEDAARYYAEQRERVSDAGLHAAKDIAASIREWRTNTFLPQQARIGTFISWTHNTEFLTIASRRLEEFKRSVQLLALVERSDIQSLFTEAGEGFRVAQDFQDRAQNALINGLDPATPTKLSLEALSRTYNSFIELSNLINALLPQGR
ncbi:MAG: hypothetical protein HYY10_00130 [Candidatus Liptonbacteria bacterium]|nr:hypothetical protein [Candidatus Liptonbacteria bacterium]